eukprot:290581-Pyramimonas_sp.AAC.1
MQADTRLGGLVRLEIPSAQLHLFFRRALLVQRKMGLRLLRRTDVVGNSLCPCNNSPAQGR